VGNLEGTMVRNESRKQNTIISGNKLEFMFLFRQFAGQIVEIFNSLTAKPKVEH